MRRGEQGAARLGTIGVVVWMAAGGLLSTTLSPAVASAIDVEHIEFFKGLDRFDGTPPPNFAYFAELCLIGTDITTAAVVLPDQSSCSMDSDFVGEYCCDRSFDTQGALDVAFPTGPGQNYTVNITGPGGPDSEVVEFDVTPPTAYTDFVSPAPGATFDPDQDLTVVWTLVDKGGCNLGAPATCGDGIAMFVSETMGTDEDIFEDDTILMTDTMATIDSMVLQAATQYRIEVETVRGSQDEANTTNGLGDPYLLSRFYEDINSIVVPEPTSGWVQAAAIAAILGIAPSCRRRR